MAVSLPTVLYEDVTKHYEGEASELGSQTYIEAQIEKSVDRLASRYGRRIKDRLNRGVLTESLFKSTVAEAVLRVVRNPEGFRTEQQGNYSYGLFASVASGYLWFTADNMLDLVGETFSPIGTALIGNHRRV